MDWRENYPKMFGKEKVQKNVASWIFIKHYLEGWHCKIIKHQKDSDVCEASNLLGGGILTNPQSLHEREICRNLQGH